MTSDAPSFGKLYALLYVFTAGAVAINLFMVCLMAQTFGLNALSPVQSILWAIPISIPVNWLVTRWVMGLMDEADGRKT